MHTKKISIIVAIAENNAIGKDNKLLWHLSGDLKRFRKLTTGHRLVMGKKTFLSLPNGPLPERINTVITDIPGERFDGCEMAYSIDEAIALCRDSTENFVIGGGMIYRQFFPLAQKLYLTRVHQHFDADTFFPAFNPEEWSELHSEHHPADEKNEFPHTFYILERKR
jgi:dihydrofolate reductase